MAMHVQSSALGTRHCPRSSAVIRQVGCLLGCHGNRCVRGLTARATSRITKTSNLGTCTTRQGCESAIQWVSTFSWVSMTG
jgi:hypothetical protein